MQTVDVVGELVRFAAYAVPAAVVAAAIAWSARKSKGSSDPVPTTESEFPVKETPLDTIVINAGDDAYDYLRRLVSEVVWCVRRYPARDFEVFYRDDGGNDVGVATISCNEGKYVASVGPSRMLIEEEYETTAIRLTTASLARSVRLKELYAMSWRRKYDMRIPVSQSHLADREALNDLCRIATAEVKPGSPTVIRVGAKGKFIAKVEVDVAGQYRLTVYPDGGSATYVGNRLHVFEKGSDRLADMMTVGTLRECVVLKWDGGEKGSP